MPSEVVKCLVYSVDYIYPCPWALLLESARQNIRLGGQKLLRLIDHALLWTSYKLTMCLTSSCRSTWAPLERSSCTTTMWPLSLASMRAVWPSWGDKTGIITGISKKTDNWMVYTCCKIVITWGSQNHYYPPNSCVHHSYYRYTHTSATMLKLKPFFQRLRKTGKTLRTHCSCMHSGDLHTTSLH